jgi:hypothetical protein
LQVVLEEQLVITLAHIPPAASEVSMHDWQVASLVAVVEQKSFAHWVLHAPGLVHSQLPQIIPNVSEPAVWLLPQQVEQLAQVPVATHAESPVGLVVPPHHVETELAAEVQLVHEAHANVVPSLPL